RLAVVQPVPGAIALGPGGEQEGPRLEIQKVQARGQRHHEAARFAARQRPNGFGGRPAAILAGRRIELMHGTALDIDPVESAILCVPERSLTEERPCRENAANVAHRRHDTGRVTRLDEVPPRGVTRPPEPGTWRLAWIRRVRD